MPEKLKDRASITAFIAVTFVLSWTCWIPLVLLYPSPSASGSGADQGNAAMVVQQILGNYGPSLAAVLMLACFGERGELRRLLARLRPRRAGLRWYPIALLLPVCALLPSALLYALLGGSVADLQLAAILPSFVLSIFISGLGEELGWRGYALPRLRAREHRQAGSGPHVASLVVGLVWAVWHLPVFWWTSTQTGIWMLVEFTLYALVIVAFSVVFGWVYNATDGSLWPVVLLHAAFTATGNHVLVALAPGRAGTWVPYTLYVLSACGIAFLVARFDGFTSRSRESRAHLFDTSL